MFQRQVKLSQSQSFFLFGARGVGKSTLLSQRFHAHERVHWIDLLKEENESRYLRSPDRLIHDVKAFKPKPDWIIIDEVQKVPKLLDIVHHLIETTKLNFVLTGSSARKLRRSSANLLAGRAFVYHLFPLTHLELGETFDLETVLNTGSLPRLFSLPVNDRSEFLRAYAQTYLREEILQEQLVRNGASFKDFLEIAALECGQSLNYSKLARDVGVDSKTIQTFFEILEDTLVGFRVPAFHRSVRKSQKSRPKFYIFDLGVKKAMEQSLDAKIIARTSAFGRAFEHFIVCEIQRLNEYFRKDFRLSHYQSTQGGEVDLILSKGRKILAIEIKSAATLDEVEVRRFSRVSAALKPSAKYLVSLDPTPTEIEDVRCLPWRQFMREVLID